MSDYLTPAEYAKQIGVCVDTVLRWIDDGELVAICISATPEARRRKHWRIKREDIVAFEESRKLNKPVQKSRPVMRVRSYV